MPRIARFGTLLVVLALVGAWPAAAQNTSGAISGTITDTQGGVLPGVSITVLTRVRSARRHTRTARCRSADATRDARGCARSRS